MKGFFSEIRLMRKISIFLILFFFTDFLIADNSSLSFDGNIAFSYLMKQVSFGPRYPGSSSHKNCRDYLIKEVKKYADSIEVQDFKFKNYNFTNIIGVFKGSGDKKILLGAHWDTRKYADMDKNPSYRKMPVPGANDGASGVAVLLEIARNLRRKKTKSNVYIVLFDAEDQGGIKGLEFCIGSRYFVNNIKFIPDYVIIVDMIGDKELSIYKELNSLGHSQDLLEKIWKIAKKQKFNEFKDTGKYAIYDDHIPFIKAGMKAVDLIDFDYPYWHTTEDKPDKCSKRSLELIGKVLMEFLNSTY